MFPNNYTSVLSWIFLLSAFIVFYNYVGYAAIVFLLNSLKKTPPTTPARPDELPTVSFIVAAYNEEDCLKEKIANSLQQNYPPGRIEFIFITDGSTDSSAAIVSSHPRIIGLHEAPRRGKSAALNRAVTHATNDILIFSDANTALNPDAVLNIARHYLLPSTGGVAGEKKVLTAHGSPDEVGAGEGLYWKYESFLKKLDSDFYSVVGAAGELFSVRRNLYEALPQDIILDDFVLSLKVAGKGYPIRYEPDAYAMELPSFSLKDEGKRKVRIAAGGFQAISLLTPLLAFWKHPRLSFLFISHRVLRWALSPFCLILAALSNAALCFGTDILLFKVLFACQIAFYLPGLSAAASPAIRKKNKLARFSYYFLFMNVSVIKGFIRYLGGRQSATWEKARRATGSLPPQ
ncbi:MAG TPA: glycosyltransferase family 2 protein [Puia sp.]|uniref:glycosyltransferase family 2 protein n=1 Tax=Puia sp. TaxID=2045100 RepID=UPI002C34054A|nr:glycosyltransferase family 2 protein [Puia sp.]HVU95082.1 glycosyltransferase family 2 protein [Puia sp.]